MIDNQKLSALVCTLPSMSDREADRAAAEIWLMLNGLILGRTRKSLGDRLIAHLDDAAQEAGLRVVEVLAEYRAGTHHQNVTNWAGYLLRCALFAVSKYKTSSAVTMGSGRISEGRRRAILPEVINRLFQELQRTPTVDELCEAFDAHAGANSKNPAKHGKKLPRREAQAFISSVTV